MELSHSELAWLDGCDEMAVVSWLWRAVDSPILAKTSLINKIWVQKRGSGESISEGTHPSFQMSKSKYFQIAWFFLALQGNPGKELNNEY